MQEIDITTLSQWIESRRDFDLIDTLPATAYEKGHLPGAKNIRSDDILNRAAQALPDKARDIVVYCASPNCKRAGLSAARLGSLGYAHVFEFTGGKRVWRDAGHALVGTEHPDGT